MKTKLIIGSTITGVIIVGFIVAMLIWGPFGSGTIKQLESVEVLQYQGQNLSSVNDFRENSIKGPQKVDISSYKLEVTGLVNNPATYTYNEVIKDYTSYKKVVRLNCVEGWAVNILWEGVQVREIINKSKPKQDAKVIIFHAYDGYTTSFPIEFIMNKPILMAYKMNEIAVPPERGYPFVLVAEDKWGYKWIKWITKIELSADTNYQGYWESRGYSNEGDRNKPSIDLFR